MKALVKITLKQGVLDPQGKAIAQALGGLGFSGIGNVRQGKLLEIELEEQDRGRALSSLEDMCEKLLANTVIEDYEISLEET